MYTNAIMIEVVCIHVIIHDFIHDFVNMILEERRYFVSGYPILISRSLFISGQILVEVSRCHK